MATSIVNARASVLLAAVAALGCVSCSKLASTPTSDGSKHQLPEWRVPSTESLIVHSTVAGRDYQITVALPRGYSESTARYPALYLLDANWSFPIAVETARLLAIGPREHPNGDLSEQPVLVGIGYPVGLYRNAIPPRLKDLTPTPDPDLIREVSRNIGFSVESSGSGGASAFLAALADDVVPEVERRYRLDSNRRSLFGHSLGGLFAVHVLFHRPELFESYLITSPALWWGQGAIWKSEEEFRQTGKELRGRVLLMSGSLDDGQLPSTKKLDDVFRSRAYRGLVWHTEVFDNETHSSVGALSLSRGIRWLYGDLAPKS